MYNAIDIARYVINYSIDNEHQISNLKLQKLLYYIQAAFLVNSPEPCFAETIENWRHGPVVQKVYDEYKKYLNEEITQKQLDYTIVELNDEAEFVTNIYTFDDAIIKDEDKKVIENIVKSYFDFGAWNLVARTHEEDPWKNTIRGQEISNNLIKKYFQINKDRIYGALYA